MHNEPAHGGATLSGGACSGKDDAAQRQVQIRGWAHDCCVVTAQLQQVAAKTRGHARSNFAAHAGRSGGRNEFNARVVEQHLADIPVAEDEVADVLILTAIFNGAREKRMRTKRR